MILSEEKLEQLVCSQLSINREEAYLFTAKFGFVWADVSYQVFVGQQYYSLWFGKVEQGQQVRYFACTAKGAEFFVLPEGVFNYNKTLNCLGLFMDNQYFYLIVGTDGRQRIIPKNNLSWDNVRRQRYYGGSSIPSKGDLVRAESQGKKFLAWIYYDDACICSFFNIEDSRWMEPSEISSWKFELSKILFLGEEEFYHENKCIERCEFK